MKSTGLYRMKPWFVAALHPLEDRLVRMGTSANLLTGIGATLAAATAAALMLAPRHPLILVVVPLTCLARMTLNALDGSIARRTDTTSARGAVGNELADHAGDLVVIVSGLAVAPPVAVVPAAILALLADDVATIDWAVHGRRRTCGVMGKPDRSFVIGAAALAGLLWPAALTAGFWLIAAGSALTVWTRMRLALRAGLERAP